MKTVRFQDFVGILASEHVVVSGDLFLRVRLPAFFSPGAMSWADGSSIHPFVNAWREYGHVQASDLHGVFPSIVPV